jgi:hypothetical protein
MMGPDWRSALREELDPLLDSLVRGEGAPPALRYRIEGFARAVCSLGLAPPEEVVRCLRVAYADVLGPSAENFTDDDFRVLEGATHWPCVPVRLPRAPVYAGASP